MKKLLASCLLLSILLPVIVAEDQSRGYIVEIGQPAPEFEIQLVSGEKVTMNSLKGKVLMLQFTASWCGVCRKEMPFIEEEIWQPYKDRNDFALIGVDRDEPQETVLNFAKTIKVTYPLGLDPDADIFGLFALKQAGVTRNVIIGKDGKNKYLTRLFNREEFDKMKLKIEQLFEE